MKPLLFSPVCDFDTLKAAVENGADAVYFGVKKFNARLRAKNFDIKDIRKITSYCHKNGVKCYLTLNTLIKNHELNDFFKTLNEAYINQIDGVIIQHLSFIDIIKDNFPDLEVNVSTQAGINNVQSLALIKRADSVTLPRELSYDEVKEISKHKKTQIFVHGALCFSFSGQCLMSSMLGGRSGNRGLCAQPCRKKYNGEYLLSTKDLCLANKINEIKKLGVNSLKIEGRLRSKEYVAAVTKLYRLALDDTFCEKDFENAKLTFNRDFTEGFLFNDAEILSKQNPTNRGLFLGIYKDKKIELNTDLSVGDGIGVWDKGKRYGYVVRQIKIDGKDVFHAKKGQIVELPINLPDNAEIYKTSANIKNIKLEIKRKEIKEKPRKRVMTDFISKIINFRINNKITDSKKEILFKAYSAKQYRESKVKSFYNLFEEDFVDGMNAYVPRMLSTDEVNKALELIKNHNVKSILTGDLGILPYLQDKEIYLDVNLNVFNDIDLYFFNKTTPIISTELNLNELSAFKNKNFAVYIHGFIPLITTKHNLGLEEIKDEKNFTFKIRKEYNYWQILNSKKTAFFNDTRKLMTIGINKFFIDGDTSAIPKYQKILEKEINDRKLRKGKTTSHLFRGVK